MVVIFARSWQQDNEPRSDTRYTTPSSGSLSSTIHPWTPPLLVMVYTTRPDASNPRGEKQKGWKDKNRERERERQAEDWCVTVILNCKLIHRPFEINLYLGIYTRLPSRSIRFSIYFSLIFAHPFLPHPPIFVTEGPEVISFDRPTDRPTRRCCARGSTAKFRFPTVPFICLSPGIRARNNV